MGFLDKPVNLRLREIEHIEMDMVINKNPDVFENVSHFVRCAIIRYLREWKEDKKAELNKGSG